MIEKLRPLLEIAAKKLLDANEKKRFILLRYHNDADGISGALALSSFIKFKSQQQKSAVYSEKDANYDITAISHEQNPIVILVDFGGSEESKTALKMLRQFADVFIIDHHPPAQNIEKIAFMVNPWLIKSEEKSSKYTAGYLCAAISNYAGKENEELAAISCAGDKSDLLKINEKHKNKALVLDYLACSGKKYNLDYYEKILNDKEYFLYILNEAKEEIKKITDLVVKDIKSKEIGKLRVYLLNLDRIFENFRSRGKIATYVYEKLDNENSENAIILIAYSERAVMLRLNEKALKIGVNATELLKEMKISMKDFVENAGGHNRAAAARVALGFTKSVVEEIMKILEKNYA